MEIPTARETENSKSARDMIIEACGADAHFLYTPDGKPPVIMDINGAFQASGSHFEGMLESGNAALIEEIITKFQEQQALAEQIKELNDGSFEALKAEGDRQLEILSQRQKA